ncbi:aldose 1-epimerase [Neotabrizicola sp. VNH66]|uniref:aldose 1-epimerase n=1 Tax=Neotabrizicola sp. VNH66 TaxID=3400918 RepID=UPI003C03AB66
MLTRLSLAAQGYALVVAPGQGATILSASWRHPSGRDVPLLHPLSDPAAGWAGGIFVMAPFANRIAGGAFDFGSRRHKLPLNRPEEGMAIHGMARDLQWRIAEQRPAQVRLVLEEVSAGPWHFDMVQDLGLSDEGIRIGLTITNRGQESLPFGLGLHPWFPRPDGTRLTFSAAGAHRRDERGLPLPEVVPVPGLSQGDGRPLQDLPPLDACFSGWTPRTARILWSDAETALTLRAEGALRHLHIYLPAERPVFCAEPVSHLPDAVNRPDLGPEAAMTPLAPGERLSGAITLTAHEVTA